MDSIAVTIAEVAICPQVALCGSNAEASTMGIDRNSVERGIGHRGWLCKLLQSLTEPEEEMSWGLCLFRSLLIQYDRYGFNNGDRPLPSG